jgi:hypothetical protein
MSAVGQVVRTRKPKLGELRPSQLLFAFGVGSIVDLPNLSVMVMGLDDWDDTKMRVITEPRLLDAVRALRGPQVKELRLPPMPEQQAMVRRPGNEQDSIGVPVASFPRWLFCTRCRKLGSIASGLFQLDDRDYRPDRVRYYHDNCHVGNKSEVLPVRFLMACENGHLDDFPWVRFVHRGVAGCAGSLEMRSMVATGEAAGQLVVCKTCNAKRPMSDAFTDDAPEALGACTGRRPQLRDYDPTPCGCEPRAMLLGASNLWFPVPLSSLFIPEATDELGAAVELQWARLSKMPDASHVTTARNFGVLGDLASWSDEEIWAAIEAQRRRGDAPRMAQNSLRVPEWEAFTRSGDHAETDEFKLREVAVPEAHRRWLRRVVVVERLREVRALIGFTRINSPGELGEPGFTLQAPLGPISRRDTTWVPASEVRGEGVFLELDEEALTQWLGTAEARERDRLMFAAHREDRARHHRAPVDAHFPGLRYVILHSLSHALLRRLAVECGYTMASIRERLYSHTADESGPSMAGLLLYTAAPDSEGTLGGLVRLGEPEQLGRLLDGCLHEAETCSSDPLCAERDPAAIGHGLHGAACHACLFLPETSCERANRYLDRASIVRVFGREVGGFFSAR